jgi:hypothetical protein
VSSSRGGGVGFWVRGGRTNRHLWRHRRGERVLLRPGGATQAVRVARVRLQGEARRVRAHPRRHDGRGKDLKVLRIQHVGRLAVGLQRKLVVEQEQQARVPGGSGGVCMFGVMVSNSTVVYQSHVTGII